MKTRKETILYNLFGGVAWCVSWAIMLWVLVLFA